MAQKITGIDIGSYCVKAVRLKSTLGGGYEYVDSFYEPIDRALEDYSNSAVRAVKKIVRENKLESDTIVAAVPAQNISGRFITLPFSDKKKIDQVINYEIENYVPFSVDDITADYQMISKSKDGSNIFVQVAKKSDIDAVSHILEQAGLDPKYLDSEGLALYSALSYYLDDGKCRAILEIGHSKSLLTIIKKGKPAYSHCLDFGGAYINERISKSFDVSLQKADELKKENNLKEVNDIISDCIKELADILKRNIVSFEMIHKEALHEILLTGGSSNISGIGELLQNYLNIKFRKVSLPDMIQKGVDTGAEGFSITACGIALRAKNSAKLSGIDLKKDKTTSIKESKYILSSLVKVFVMILVLITFYTADLLIKKNDNEAMLKSYEKQIFFSFSEALPKTAAKGRELLVIKEKIAEANIQSEKFGALLSKSITTMDMLKELTLRISEAGKDEDVEIYECSFDGKRLKILGETKSYNLTDEIKKSLEHSDMFGEVKMEYAKFTANQKKVKFSMKIALKEKGE